METLVPTKKLKVTLSGKRVEPLPWSQSCVEDSCKASDQCKYSIHPSEGIKSFATNIARAKSSIPVGKKRKAAALTEAPKVKGKKMDRSVTPQCAAILKTLMSHPAGWVFNQPVDPVALKIPDYFLIISQPMDLGTVKSKLKKNMYQGTEEFAADVRLTFSNAVHYNPPGNNVHKMAKELCKVFEIEWKWLEEKWSGGQSKCDGQGKPTSGRVKETNYTRENDQKAPLPCNNSLPKKSMQPEAKVIKQSLNVNDADAGLAKTVHSCEYKSTRENINKGTGGTRNACHSASAKQQPSSVSVKCSMCGHVTCYCRISCESTHASSDISLERSVARNHRESANNCRLSKCLSTSEVLRSDPDSDGAVSALDDENKQPSNWLSTPVSDATSAEEWSTPILEVPMSPERALRAAMLKRRFADTILKAQQKTLRDHGDKANSVKLLQKMKQLEKMQREEWAHKEAQIRAAEAASRTRAEAELKQQRERERAAARIALEKMEKTVEIEHNLDALKELEKLIGEPLVIQSINSIGRRFVMGKFPVAQPKALLKRLGIVLKNEFVVDEDEDTISSRDSEDGEILP